MSGVGEGSRPSLPVAPDGPARSAAQGRRKLTGNGVCWMTDEEAKNVDDAISAAPVREFCLMIDRWLPQPNRRLLPSTSGDCDTFTDIRTRAYQLTHHRAGTSQLTELPPGEFEDIFVCPMDAVDESAGMKDEAA